MWFARRDAPGLPEAVPPGAAEEEGTGSQVKRGLTRSGIRKCVLIASGDFQRGRFSVLHDTLTFKALMLHTLSIIHASCPGYSDAPFELLYTAFSQGKC